MERSEISNISEQRTEFLFKILIVGDSSVGKTNIISRYTRNQFSEDTEATLGVDFTLHPTEIKGKKLTAQFWDTAGQEQFRSMSSAYYKNAHGAVIVYDVTRRLTFDNILSWLNEIKNYTDKDIKVILLGNKKDLFDQVNVTKEEAENFAKEHDLFFLEVSAKDNSDKSLDLAFENLFGMLLETPLNESKVKEQMKFNKIRNETFRDSKNNLEIQMMREAKTKIELTNIPEQGGQSNSGGQKKGCC